MTIPLVCHLVFQTVYTYRLLVTRDAREQGLTGLLLDVIFAQVACISHSLYCCGLNNIECPRYMCTTFRNLTCYHYLIFGCRRKKVSRVEFNTIFRYFVVIIPSWDLGLSYRRFLEGKSSAVSSCSVGNKLLSGGQLSFYEYRSRLNPRNVV